MNIFRSAKAIVGAAVTAAATAFGAASNDGVITQQEWAVVVGSAIVAGVVVWLTPNKPAKAA